MHDITELLQEAKPLYKARKRNRRLAAISSTLGVLCISFMFAFNTQKVQQMTLYDIWSEEIDQTQNGSVIEDMGLPVDEYGLLWIS